MLLKVAAFVIACNVTLLSALKTATSEFLPDATDGPTVRVSLLGPLIYWTAISLSKFVVVSKSWKSFGAMPGVTILLKSPACTPPKRQDLGVSIADMVDFGSWNGVPRELRQYFRSSRLLKHGGN
jgi:hypothetical protein